MRLAVVVYSVNNLEWTKLAIKHLRDTADPSLTRIFLVDNGSSPTYRESMTPEELRGVYRILRYEDNIGGNAVFHRWMEDNWFEGELPEFVAFFHCDLMIHEQHWDQRVIESFDGDSKLNLIGFAGSNEIDGLGGRGAGTMLNYRGAFFEGIGQASPAEAHGRRMSGLEPAAVLDHMSMIFRRTALEQLTPQEGNYAPEHFYDRILSCEVLENGGRIAVLGIDCDHFSGGIAGGNLSADQLRRRWLDSNGVAYDPNRTDLAVYVESERRFKNRYIRNGFAPLRVLHDYSIIRPGRIMV